MTSSHVFLRRWDKPLPTAIRGSGVWLEDAAGKRYLDACGGPICVNLGHGRGEIVEAMSSQASILGYAHPTMFAVPAVDHLADRLAQVAPPNIDRFYFLSSGSEAVEAAIKFARQFHLAAGRQGRYRVVSRWQSYHGCTLGALSATGKPGMRKPFTPLLPPHAIHIPPPYCLRCHYNLTYPTCGLRCAHALEEIINLEGPETIAAFIAEPVCGATLAAVVPPQEYCQVVRDICCHHDILFILDEVMTGMGRTGTWFAAQHYDIQPDIIVLGKGLGGGYLPLSAIGCREGQVKLVVDVFGGFTHGHTFSHHPVAAAAGIAVMDIIEQEQLLTRVQRMGQLLGELLAPLTAHRHVADVRGMGLMWGIEFVADRKTLTPFSRSEKVTERLFDALMAAGVLVYKCAGVAGQDGDAIMVGPPFIISEEELMLLVCTLREVLEEFF
ncbi:MAG: aspartate aminotransferase family protein [Deltaproteobacteria bacterium]|nr:aspartate aminotransferase family protein [Candidatus Anaeroferrophillus wilburensis]MBN2889011.1 aspartate aminotransferase family protein [Deltaproteobacteria bacterium]